MMTPRALLRKETTQIDLKKDKPFEEAVEDLLLYLEVSAPDRSSLGESTHGMKMNKLHVDVSHFSPAIPIGVFDSLEHGDVGFFSDASPFDVEPNFDLSTMIKFDPNCSQEGEKKKTIFQVQRTRRLNPAAWRGKLRQLYPYMIEWSLAHIFEDNSYFSYKMPMGFNGSTWTDCLNREGPNGNGGSPKLIVKVNQDELNSINMHYGIGFTRRYNWQAIIGSSPKAAISIFTDPYGAQELFRLRDIPEGRKRRAAIKNWISSHWRQRRADPSESTKVRQHLRGALEFNWNGLYVKIIPSAFDLELNQTLAEQRKLLHK